MATEQEKIDRIRLLLTRSEECTALHPEGRGWGTFAHGFQGGLATALRVLEHPEQYNMMDGEE